MSVAVAVICAGWAIYATNHADKPSGFVPPGGAAAGAAKPGAARSAPSGKPSDRPGGGRGGAPGGPGGGGGMPIPVVSAAVASAQLSRDIVAVGTARANEAVEITAKSSNIVTRVLFRDGQSVRAGDVLVELDSAQARADLAIAQAAVTESTSQYNRSRELLSTQVLSKSQFEQLEATKLANEARRAAARARLEDTVIRAPFSGRVGLRRVSVGSLINPGAIITTLDDTSSIKLDFAVPENVVTSLRAGLNVKARSTAYPEREFAGTVASVDSRVDPTTRSVTVRALVPNKDGALRPGMFLTVDLQSEQRSALVIPEEALVPEQDQQYVFVVKGANVERRVVRIGARSPGTVEVLAGLAAAERVVVEGTIRIRDGSAVTDQAAGPTVAGPAADVKDTAGGTAPGRRSAP